MLKNCLFTRLWVWPTKYTVAPPEKNIGEVKMSSHLMTSYYQWRSTYFIPAPGGKIFLCDTNKRFKI